MAKKSTSKKSTAKPSSKKAPVKPRTKTSIRKKPQQARSFKLAKETQPFVSFSATRQTVYWAIFAFAVLLLGLWLIRINVQVQELYDQIDENRVVQDELDVRLQEALEKKKIDQ